MNICSDIPTDGSNLSDDFFYNGTDIENEFLILSLDIIVILLGFPTNSYVIWLIVTGTGNRLAAEFFSLNLSICEMFFYMECLLNRISYEIEHVWIANTAFDSLATTGRPLFQCLICVERYLAVVHPVTFLKYKPLRYRVICSGIVWVAGFSSGGVSVVTLWFNLSGLYFIFSSSFAGEWAGESSSLASILMTFNSSELLLDNRCAVPHSGGKKPQRVLPTPVMRHWVCQVREEKGQGPSQTPLTDPSAIPMNEATAVPQQQRDLIH